MERKANPLIDLVYKNEKGDTRTFATNISDHDLNNVEAVSVSIDNLLRQGLIEIPDDRHYTEKALYDSILNSDYYKSQQEAYPDKFDEFKFSHNEKVINKTNLGKLFYDICVCD